MWLHASQSGSLLAGRRSLGQHMKLGLFPHGQQKRLMSKAHAVAAAVASSKAGVMSLMNNLSPTTDKQREHVVVLGTGWAAVNFFRNLDPSKFEVTVVSPRNYFTFTPLLPSVCAGTLTPLSCIEPVRGFSWDRRGRRLLNFYEAHATDVDFKNKRIACASLSSHFKLDYDKLVVAVGTDSNTFNLPGVKENAFFLKEVEHAVQIRKRVMSNFEAAALPTTSQADRERLLHFVVVGGGPTGVEAAAEFADVVRDDMKKFFPELMSHVTITLIEGGSRLLPTYAAEIGEYAEKVLKDTLGVRLLLRHQVTSVGPDTLTCKPTDPAASKDQTKVVRHGFVLWASGIGQVPLVQKLLKERLPEIEGKPLPPSVRALPVDERLRVHGVKDVFAMGDCAQIVPKSLAAAADELWTRAGCCDASLAWLKKEAKRLRLDYPQLSPLKFDLNKEEDKGPMNKEQFRQLLERIDAAYRSPAATAQNARQAGVYLAKAFNAGLGNELPAFCEEWKGSLAYVGNHNAVAQLPGYIVKGGFFSLPLWKPTGTGELVTPTGISFIAAAAAAAARSSNKQQQQTAASSSRQKAGVRSHFALKGAFGGSIRDNPSQPAEPTCCNSNNSSSNNNNSSSSNSSSSNSSSSSSRRKRSFSSSFSS
ncbi:hypothetical protein Emed_001564 [Eimeria media]